MLLAVRWTPGEALWPELEQVGLRFWKGGWETVPVLRDPRNLPSTQGCHRSGRGC